MSCRNNPNLNYRHLQRILGVLRRSSWKNPQLPGLNAAPGDGAGSRSEPDPRIREHADAIKAITIQTLVLRPSQMIQPIRVRAVWAAVSSRLPVNHLFASEH